MDEQEAIRLKQNEQLNELAHRAIDMKLTEPERRAAIVAQVSIKRIQAEKLILGSASK